MDPKTVRSIVMILSTIWLVFLFPVVLMIILAFDGAASLGIEDGLTHSILYYNILLYPIILGISIMGSWLSLKYEKYRAAIAWALIPLANVFIEIVAADIALWLR